MIRFEFPYSYDSRTTAWNVAVTRTGHGNKGAYIHQCQRYLINLLSSVYKPRVTGTVLYASDVKTIINNIDPAYLEYQSGSSGHALALCGYSIVGGTEVTIKLMNPGTAKFEYVFRPNTLTYNNRAWTWVNSIRLYY